MKKSKKSFRTIEKITTYNETKKTYPYMEAYKAGCHNHETIMKRPLFKFY